MALFRDEKSSMQIGYEIRSQEMYIYRTIKLCKQHFVIPDINMTEFNGRFYLQMI